MVCCKISWTFIPILRGWNESDDENARLQKLEERISSWRRMVRVVGTMLLFCDKLNGSQRTHVKLTVEILQKAEISILQAVQRSYMQDELEAYSHIGGNIKAGKIHKLDPFMEDGLLKVGGRLKESTFIDSISNPVILPKESKFSVRIVEHFYCETQ